MNSNKIKQIIKLLQELDTKPTILSLDLTPSEVTALCAMAWCNESVPDAIAGSHLPSHMHTTRDDVKAILARIKTALS